MWPTTCFSESRPAMTQSPNSCLHSTRNKSNAFKIKFSYLIFFIFQHSKVKLVWNSKLLTASLIKFWIGSCIGYRSGFFSVVSTGLYLTVLSASNELAKLPNVLKILCMQCFTLVALRLKRKRADQKINRSNTRHLSLSRPGSVLDWFLDREPPKINCILAMNIKY